MEICRAEEIWGAALVGADVLRRDAVGAADLRDDPLDRDGHRLVVVEDVADRVLRDDDRRVGALQELVGLELLDGALKLADVRLKAVGDVLGHVVGDLDVQQLRLAADDRDARLIVGRLDVREQPHSKRVRSLSSSVLISLGGRSDARTICLPAS